VPSQESAGDGDEEYVRVAADRPARPGLFKVAIVSIVEAAEGAPTGQPFDLLGRPIEALEANVDDASPDSDSVVLSVEVVMRLDIAGGWLVSPLDN
jgi:hypothetical protein